MLLCDLNCDLGEGIGNEEELLPFLTSANIACGLHAGDEETMKKVVDLCLHQGIAIGAHPSYPDRENFGRKDLIGIALEPKDVYDLVAVQVYQLQKIAQEAGATLHHVKPHGALYNRAAWDEEVASFLCSAIREADSPLLLYGLSGSRLKQVADSHQLDFVHEVFADRSYEEDGSLTKRSETGALIETEEAAIEQVLCMVHKKKVRARSGKWIPIEAQTVCLHGDGKQAVPFARKLHGLLQLPKAGSGKDDPNKEERL